MLVREYPKVARAMVKEKEQRETNKACRSAVQHQHQSPGRIREQQRDPYPITPQVEDVLALATRTTTGSSDYDPGVFGTNCRRRRQTS